MNFEILKDNLGDRSSYMDDINISEAIMKDITRSGVLGQRFYGEKFSQKGYCFRCIDARLISGSRGVKPIKFGSILNYVDIRPSSELSNENILGYRNGTYFVVMEKFTNKVIGHIGFDFEFLKGEDKRGFDGKSKYMTILKNFYVTPNMYISHESKIRIMKEIFLDEIRYLTETMQKRIQRCTEFLELFDEEHIVESIRENWCKEHCWEQDAIYLDKAIKYINDVLDDHAKIGQLTCEPYGLSEITKNKLKKYEFDTVKELLAFKPDFSNISSNPAHKYICKHRKEIATALSKYVSHQLLNVFANKIINETFEIYDQYYNERNNENESITESKTD